VSASKSGVEFLVLFAAVIMCTVAINTNTATDIKFGDLVHISGQSGSDLEKLRCEFWSDWRLCLLWYLFDND